MKKYLSFFKMRFIHSLQYRGAALAGMSTQFVWGFMEILLFTAFYRADPAAFPMDMQQLACYVWLQQAFLALFMPWWWENDLFDAITSGTVTYDLCRPTGLYEMWAVRAAAGRCAKATLRFIPIVVVASFLPRPYGLVPPKDIVTFLWFLLTMTLALCVVVTFTMVIYMSAFFTTSSQGTRMIFVSLADILSGSVIPLPFLPDGIRQLFELLPFASVQNVPLRVYSGNIAGQELLQAVCVQIFWFAALLCIGKWMEHCGLKKVTLAGG